MSVSLQNRQWQRDWLSLHSVYHLVKLHYVGFYCAMLRRARYCYGKLSVRLICSKEPSLSYGQFSCSLKIFFIWCMRPQRIVNFWSTLTYWLTIDCCLCAKENLPDDVDDFEEFRVRSSELVHDCVFVVGASDVFCQVTAMSRGRNGSGCADLVLILLNDSVTRW